MPPKLTPEIIAAAIEGFEAQKTRIDYQIAELRTVLTGGSAGPAAAPEPPKHKRRKMSAAGRKAIAEAQRKRWAASNKAAERSAPEAAPKPKRKLSAAGSRGDIGVAQQRQDGVIVRRGGDFDLADAGHLAIDREDLAEDLQLFASHQPLVVERVIGAFGKQVANFGVGGAELLVEPDQLRDHLEVPEILGGETAARHFEAALGVARCRFSAQD